MGRQISMPCWHPNIRQNGKSRWVFDLKLDVERYKPRLVARGFRQVAGIDYLDTLSPTACYNSIRLFLAIVAARDLEMSQIDAVTAFLNAPLEEKIYLSQTAIRV
jgi:Reverse transcriptase (RNA-dependent DNA polymerase)